MLNILKIHFIIVIKQKFIVTYTMVFNIVKVHMVMISCYNATFAHASCELQGTSNATPRLNLRKRGV